MPLSDLISLENIDPALRASSKKHTLQVMVARAAVYFGVSEHDLLQAVYEREKLGSTALGHGVAIPHARIAGIEKSQAFFARLSDPLNFDATDDEKVDLVVLLLAPDDDSNDHLKSLSQIARQLKKTDILRQLRGAEGAEAIFSTLTGLSG